MSRVEEYARVGKATGDRTRLRMLAALDVRPLCVCEMTHLVPIGQSAVSRHLAILRDAGLVEDVRDGKWVNYRLRRPAGNAFAEAALGALLDRADEDPDLRIIRSGAATVDRTRL